MFARAWLCTVFVSASVCVRVRLQMCAMCACAYIVGVLAYMCLRRVHMHVCTCAGSVCACVCASTFLCKRLYLQVISRSFRSTEFFLNTILFCLHPCMFVPTCRCAGSVNLYATCVHACKVCICMGCICLHFVTVFFFILR